MMRFCVLGTGAGGVPTLRRASPGVVVQLEGTVFLFDCGEGTQRQLLQAGVSRASIAVIAITHMHGDHVLGLVPLLCTMASEHRNKPLVLVGPRGLAAFVEQTLQAIHCTLPFALEVRELDATFQGEVLLGEQWVLRCAPLRHSVPCFGYRLTWRRQPKLDMERLRALGLGPGKLLGELKRQGWLELPDGRRITLAEVAHPVWQPAVVFCGDTLPCPEAIELAQAADVLFYEATYGRVHAALAQRSHHSTAADAALVARNAGVRRLLLMHFSSRYEDEQELLAEARAIFPEAEIAQELRWEALDPLHDERQPLTDSDTQRSQAVAGIAAVQRTD